ncbi:hypothetical protein SAMN05192583_2587 [Sphingomonas gellani]|uniref:Uncharacterized protein n=1 Tax=Sphingomonas gellani TaxID=1166340 RepID=A0A1H8FVF8_9SPHN|nr:hypothetical protein [Sphingomonas gellani]SEN35629.1 hypothetical protein SAMN05192583_2587 [Sphingomonas gellani]
MLILLHGILMAASAAAPLAMPDHNTTLPHAAGPVHSTYRADVTVTHEQVGTVGAPGRPATLGCRWTAGLNVARQARHASGATLSRSIDRDTVLSGQRAGWCDTHREAIRVEVAARSGELRAALLAAAEEDGPVLTAELDRLHGNDRTG